MQTVLGLDNNKTGNTNPVYDPYAVTSVLNGSSVYTGAFSDRLDGIMARVAQSKLNWDSSPTATTPVVSIRIKQQPKHSSDLTSDGLIDGHDLAALLAAWGPHVLGDLDDDGHTGPSDLSILLSSWGAQPPSCSSDGR